MPSLLDVVADTAARLILRKGTVTAVDHLSEHLWRVDLATGTATWAPGQKVQIRMGGINLRTYTPLAWADRSVSFLMDRHEPGRSRAWMDRLEVGATLELFGPNHSLDLSRLAAGPVLVGDETSFALAAAYAAHGRHPVAATAFEVSHPDEAAAVLPALGVPDAGLVARTAGDAHWPELAGSVVDLLRAHPGAPLVITGKAQTIRAVRGAVKAAGLSPAASVKAYWDVNRSALD